MDQLLSDFLGVLREELKLRASLIPLDILVAVAVLGRSTEVNVKLLLASLPHSPTGIRYHLAVLLEEGWLESVAARHDKSVKLLKLTRKAQAALERLADSLEGLLLRRGVDANLSPLPSPLGVPHRL